MAANSKSESTSLGSTISFRVNDDVYKCFEAQCIAANMTKSELFRDYIARNKIYVNARPAASRESRLAVSLLQTASNNLNEMLRRANTDNAAGPLTDTYYREIIKQLAMLNKFMLTQTAGVRCDS